MEQWEEHYWDWCCAWFVGHTSWSRLNGSRSKALACPQQHRGASSPHMCNWTDDSDNPEVAIGPVDRCSPTRCPSPGWRDSAHAKCVGVVLVIHTIPKFSPTRGALLELHEFISPEIWPPNYSALLIASATSHKLCKSTLSDLQRGHPVWKRYRFAR